MSDESIFKPRAGTSYQFDGLGVLHVEDVDDESDDVVARWNGTDETRTYDLDLVEDRLENGDVEVLQ